jgi:FkbM family methyltransferase
MAINAAFLQFFLDRNCSPQWLKIESPARGGLFTGLHSNAQMDKEFQRRSVNMINRFGYLRDHHFYLPLLSKSSILIDLGAHKGEFTRGILADYHCRSYMVEANPALFDALAIEGDATKYNYAVCKAEGKIPFNISDNPEGSSIHDLPHTDQGVVTVDGVTLKRLLEELAVDEVDLMKVDIEGAEYDVIESVDDDTLRRCKQITVEFHDFVPGSHANYDTEKAIARIESAGFLCVNFDKPNHNMDVLFINRRYLSYFERVNLFLFKYLRLPVYHLVAAVNKRLS